MGKFILRGLKSIRIMMLVLGMIFVAQGYGPLPTHADETTTAVFYVH